MTAPDLHLAELLSGVAAALCAVGRKGEPELALLGRLSPELVCAYSRARRFTQRAAPSIKGDALWY
ncbi:MAG TPA: hypothetical protein PLJ27_09720 [Polyangiaceae bacterium]|nr:MAG: hypothetical protein BWY17_03217 [Deltaproteobacteria bacterium ADurb.Bin207]HNS97671.1 hypothetical protein [Polyangiaceae bacterium]HNZ24750.1 hypothetical protein [Polyangiaceae bacterium]HOE51629.1 hypothetical protein [Polyangiaceae bacterium]HOH02889.1 hypothetical protein [Polyangiaceae bacterium]